ncbi:MAG: restriction endonuclease subunit S [Planctomycetes bacterium]|nr:restriction endonuclease subunit S [Planctomycetota bacterium]HNZ66450.1 restriction endonuclease subunit S [Planctomycetota bacterium]HPY75441.1 restriction endonuclease subunit S [Planctomycetota bacterium]HQB00851.1 restriction endonuclease subunit S [Planctomycetota bacterium]
MSLVNELLKKEKVEWEKLGEVFHVRTGYTPPKRNKKFWKNGTVPWFTIEDIRDRGRVLHDANIKISQSGVKKVPFKADSLILSITATIGEYALINVDFIVNQQFIVFSTKEQFQNKVNMNYMRYYFSKISEYCKKNKRIANIPTVDTDKILKLEIPIPSIEMQKKIVKILDSFTNYITILQDEYKVRTKQYEYYRNLLLSEKYIHKISAWLKNEKVEWKKLGEVCKILNYKRKLIAKSKRSTGKYPYYGANGIQDYVDSYIFEGSFILMGEDGSVINKDNTPVLHWVNSSKIWVNNHAHVLGKLSSQYILKYIYYFLTTVDVSPIVKGISPKINQANMKNIDIFIPSIPVQKYIVSILDIFHALVHDISDGLPKEIKLRQKQYEYYRDQLLHFPKEIGNE